MLIPILFLFILCGLFLVRSVKGQSSAYSAGDLIKTRYSSTVYYFGYDGKRHAFPNEPIYFSWYSNFDGIKIVTPGELAEIPLSSSIVVRPGTNLIKIQTDPKVYAVEPYGVLRHVTSESLARTLFGENWASKVLDLDVAFFPDYKIGTPITYQAHPENTVFRYLNEGDKTYIYKNGKAWAFRDMVKAQKHRYQERFILTLTKPAFSYTAGYKEIDEIHPILVDTAQTLRDDELLGNIPAATPVTQTPTGGTVNTGSGGLMGYYYSDINFGTKQLERIDSTVNFSWDHGSPAPQMPSDNFSVRWFGKIKIDIAGDYTFYTWSDDGVRLYMDDNLIINNWTEHMVEWNHGSAYLTAGYHNIRLEYFEKIGGAFIKFCWYGRDTVVPSSILYPDTSYYFQSY